MKRFSEFSTESTPLDGKKVKIDDILNKELIVCDFKIGKSKYPENETGQYATIQIKTSEDEEPMVIFTGSTVLCEQIKKYENYIPFQTVIKRFNRYYSFT